MRLLHKFKACTRFLLHPLKFMPQNCPYPTK